MGGTSNEGTIICLTLGTSLQDSRRLRVLVEVKIVLVFAVCVYIYAGICKICSYLRS
jgi:hypothetical protein